MRLIQQHIIIFTLIDRSFVHCIFMDLQCMMHHRLFNWQNEKKILKNYGEFCDSQRSITLLQEDKNECATR